MNADFSTAVAELVQHYGRQPQQSPDSITGLPGYREMLEGAEDAGWLDPVRTDIDEHFAERSPEWIAAADLGQRRKWMHTLLRAERWSSECPTHVIDALRRGQLTAFAATLDARV